MMRIFFNDFQLNFLKILSGATLLYESYSFDSRDSCSFFLNANCTNDTNIFWSSCGLKIIQKSYKNYSNYYFNTSETRDTNEANIF